MKKHQPKHYAPTFRVIAWHNHVEFVISKLVGAHHWYESYEQETLGM